MMNIKYAAYAITMFLTLFFVGAAAPLEAALVQHLDATASGSVVGNPVTQWTDQSGNGNHAIDNHGSVFFPGTSLSPTDLAGLDFGTARNDLILFNGADTSALLDFSGAAAGNEGFSVAVVFKVDEMPGTDQHVMGTHRTNGRFSIRVDPAGAIRFKLDNNIPGNGTQNVVAGDTVVVTLTYDAATGAYIFWDSLNDSSLNGTQSINGNYGGGDPLLLGEGNRNGSSTDYLRGMIGEVYIYNSVLSPVELQQLQDALVVKWVGGEEPPPPVDPGPGVANVTQTAGAMLADFNADSTGADTSVRTVVMDWINGYLYMDTRDLATSNSSHTVHAWDLSDPSSPVEASRFGGDRGQHTSQVFLPNHRVNADGDRFLNVRDPLNMFYEEPTGYITKDMGTRSCSLLPYQYSGGNIIEIYDARTATTIASISDHGFDCQAVAPIGNILVVAGLRDQQRGVATYDISDPTNPILLDVIAPSDPIWNDINPAYEPFIWKHFIVIPNVLGGGTGDDCAFVDFSDPSDLRHVLYMNGDGTYGTGLPGRTRYAQFQDNRMFLGSGVYDMTPLESDQEPILERVFLEQDGEYLLPLGNLLVSAENTTQGTIAEAAGPYPVRIFAHQSAPDTTAPTVAYHNPADGAVNQHVKSRIGVVIHETLDYATINSNNFRVFPLAGGPDVTGTLSATDKDVVVFTPDTDLSEGATYRVELQGIEDAVGNAMALYSFDFTIAGQFSEPPPVVTDLSYTSGYPAAVNSTVDLAVTVSDGIAPLEYRWDFGDGSPQTAWSTADSSISHLYVAEGHHRVVVQVRDSALRTATASVVVTVTDSPGGTPPTKGSQIIVDEGNRRVWTVNPDNDTVTEINADTLANLNEFGVGKDPRSIALDNSGNLWITCLDDNSLEVRSTAGVLLDSIDFGHGARPHDVVFNASGTFAYVSLKGGGKIVRINPSVSPLQVDAELSAGDTVTAIAVNSSTDELLLNRFISPDTAGEIHLYNNVGGAIGFAQTIALAVDTTSVEDGESARGLPNYLADVAIDPFGEFAYVTAKQDNILRGGFKDGQPLTHETSVRAIVSKIDLASNTEVDRLDIDNSSQPSALAFSPLGDYLFIALQGNNHIRVRDSFSGSLIATLETGLAPQGMCFDSSSNRLFVKNLTDRTVTVHDLTSALEEGDFAQSPVNTIGTVGNEIFIPDVLLGKQIFYNADDERMSLEGYLSCATCHQDGDHDGRTWDFTDRGEGLRNTINLRGRTGTAQGNVHWSANFDEIQDFELDIVNAFGGDGFLAASGGPNPSLGASNAGISADLDALAAYVASLGVESIEESPYRNPDSSLTSDAIAGKQLFDGTVVPMGGTALSCASCHDPANEFTDSVVGQSVPPIVLHDVGTIKASSGERLGGGGGSLVGIDTPTLLGLHASAPYLHDGSAPTVDAAFDQFDAGAAIGTDGSAHNLSSSGYNLSAQERADLVAYLLQIDGSPDLDTTPPLPNPMTWAVVPAAISSSEVTMTATTATDPSGGIEYRFQTRTNGTVISNSDWQSDVNYTATGLAPETEYGFRVRARDAFSNFTVYSVEELATTLALPNGAPSFTSDPVVEANGDENVAYNGTLADDASDPESDPMTFSKVSGPAWLNIASDGTLSGTPTSGDVGLNSFSVQVDATGGSDSATLEITIDAVGGPIADYAQSESTALGTVSSGSIADTLSNDDVYEVLTEAQSGGNPNNRRSQLEHTWTFNVTGDEIVTFYVEAHHDANSEGDDFVFSYSTDNVNFMDMVTVTKTADDGTAQFFSLPGSLNGTVYIKVVDTDRTRGNSSTDSLYVDAIFITSESASVPPTVASDPNPSDGATGVSTAPTLSWLPGTLAASHDVYFGTSPTPTFQSNQTVAEFSPGTLNTSTTYYWVIDEVNGAGTTAGTVWSFTTGAGTPDMHVASIVLGTQKQGKNYRGTTTVTVVESGSGNPVQGAVVSGDFTGAFSEAGSATTDASGVAVITTSAKIPLPFSFTFTVTDVTEAGHVYNAANNVETSDSGSF